VLGRTLPPFGIKGLAAAARNMIDKEAKTLANGDTGKKRLSWSPICRAESESIIIPFVGI
jgi:hypothetical protein